jgi:hypothetical protein
MDAPLEQLVYERAGFRCEYCHIPEAWDALPFHVDHVVAQKHHGKTTSSNLALACYTCNLHKGPNLSGIDSVTNKMVRLFHPRRHDWSHHFRWNGAILEGRTAIGRATVDVLAINVPHRVDLRRLLIAVGVFATA